MVPRVYKHGVLILQGVPYDMDVVGRVAGRIDEIERHDAVGTVGDVQIICRSFNAGRVAQGNALGGAAVGCRTDFFGGREVDEDGEPIFHQRSSEVFYIHEHEAAGARCFEYVDIAGSREIDRLVKQQRVAVAVQLLRRQQAGRLIERPW